MYLISSGIYSIYNRDVIVSYLSLVYRSDAANKKKTFIEITPVPVQTCIFFC